MDTKTAFIIPEDSQKSRRSVPFAEFIDATNRELFKVGIPPIESDMSDEVSDELDRIRVEFGNGATVADLVKYYTTECLPTPEERRDAMAEFLDANEESLEVLGKRLAYEGTTKAQTHKSMLAQYAKTCGTTEDVVERAYLAFQGGQWSELIPSGYTLEKSIELFAAADRDGREFIVNPEDLTLNKSVSEFPEYQRAFARVAIANGMTPGDDYDDHDAIKELYEDGITIEEAVSASKAAGGSDEDWEASLSAYLDLKGVSAAELLESYAKPVDLGFTEQQWREKATALDRAVRFHVLESEIPRYAKGTQLEGTPVELLRSDSWKRNDTLGRILAEIDQHRNYLFGSLGFEQGDELLGVGRKFVERGMSTVPGLEIYMEGATRASAERSRGPRIPVMARPPGFYESELHLADGTKIATLSEAVTNTLRKQGVQFREKQVANDVPLPAVPAVKPPTQRR